MNVIHIKSPLAIHAISEKQGFNKNNSLFFNGVVVYDLKQSVLTSVPVYELSPAIVSLDSGYIIDGKYVITDEGVFIAEGFQWSASGVVSEMMKFNEANKNNKKINSESDTTLRIDNILIDIPTKTSIPCYREIDDTVLEDAMFLGGFNNLSHFLMEILPKAARLQQTLNVTKTKKIAYSDKIPTKWIDYFLKISNSVYATQHTFITQKIPESKAVRFKNLSLISSGMFRNSEENLVMSVEEARLTRDHMVKTAINNNKKEKEYVLYLSRKYAKHRKVLNQESAFEIIKKNFPDFDLVIEHKIHSLSMEEQAGLINNASVVVEEGGGSTGFTSNLVAPKVPYIIISSQERTSQAGKVYIGALHRYAAWFPGKPVEEQHENMQIDSDMILDEEEFNNLLSRIAKMLTDKTFFPVVARVV
jgi:hypothetical protein